ncbi:MAG: TolC family protein [Alistipes sp.]|nr:TolC family protein [Alistipes sp.]
MRRVAVILISIMIPFTLLAEGLTFDMAKELMMTNNLEIRSAQEAVEVKELELKAMRGLRYPSIDLVGGYVLMQRDVGIELGGTQGALSDAAQHFIGEGVSSGILSPDVAQFIANAISPLLAADWSIILQKRSSMVGAVSMVQPIYMGGRIDAAVASAEIAANSARYQLEAILNSKLTELVECYYGVIAAEMALDVRQQVVAGIKSHLADAEAMESEGMIPRSEVLYVRYKLSEAERNLRSAHNKLIIAREALSRVIGDSVSDKLTSRIFIVDEIYSLDYYIENGINFNPILLDAKSKIALSEQGVKVARAELLPEVAAFGGATIVSHNLTDLIPRWSVGVGIRLKLFDGLGKERRFQAAKQLNRVAHTAVSDAESGIRLIIENEYYSSINSLYDVGSMQATIDFATSYLQAKSDGFNEGVTPSSEVIDAQLALSAAKLEQSVAAFTFCKSLARLLEASGLSHTFDEYNQKAIFL